MDSMQQAKDQKENVEQTQKDVTLNSAEGKHTIGLVKKNNHHLHNID